MSATKQKRATEHEPAKVGRRPRLLDAQVRRRLLEAIRAGGTHELACNYAGIAPSTFYDAMAKARAGDAEYASLIEEVAEAEGAGAVQCLAVIRKAAVGGQWQAAAWTLERRYPRMYGRAEARPNEAAAKTDAPPPASASDDPLKVAHDAARRMRIAAETAGSYVAASNLLRLETETAEKIRVRDEAAAAHDFAHLGEEALVDLVCQVAHTLPLPLRVRVREALGTA